MFFLVSEFCDTSSFPGGGREGHSDHPVAGRKGGGPGGGPHQLLLCG